MSLFSCSSITNSTVPGIKKIPSTVSHFQQVKHFHDVSSCLICLLNPTPIDHSPLEVFPIYKLVSTFPKFPVVLSAQWKDYLPGRQTLHVILWNYSWTFISMCSTSTYSNNNQSKIFGRKSLFPTENKYTFCSCHHLQANTALKTFFITFVLYLLYVIQRWVQVQEYELDRSTCRFYTWELTEHLLSLVAMGTWNQS